MIVLRRLAAIAACVVAGTTLSAVGPVASADVTVAEAYPVPASGVYTLEGHGWGHGHGMSQWGAYGAAKVGGLAAPAILSFYYPGTTLHSQSGRTVRVRMHAAGATVTVAPVTGQTLTASTTVSGIAACPLPTSLDGGATTVKWWRAAVVSAAGTTGEQLQATVDGSTWRPVTVPGCATAWSQPMAGSITFADGPSVALVFAGGAVTRYRGVMRAAFTGSGLYPVNVVGLEAYLRSVVPSEMPASWSPAALQAQAVAARTYASYGIQHPKTAYYDVYDDTRDQAYTGIGNEDPRSDSAVSATAGQVLLDSTGHAAFTQFSAADGGWTVAGGQPYLPAQPDRYDGAVPNSADTWTASLSASTVNAAFGSQIGALQEIDVTGRDGNGEWGGRVTSLMLRGSTGSVTMSGTAFRGYFGLRSEWFHMQVPPAPPTYVTATALGPSVTVTWRPPAASSGAPVTGYRVSVLPGGPTQDLPASARGTTLTGVAPGTGQQVSVAALSDPGVGRSATVTTKVHRLSGGNAVGIAVAVSQATFTAGGARSVVLADTRDGADALAGGPFAVAHRAPLLLTSPAALSPATRAEIRRVLPAGRVVYLLGGAAAVEDRVRVALRSAGYRVVRFAGADAAGTAALLASQTRGVQAVFEVTGRSWTDALLAAPAASAAHAVILLTDGAHQSPATAAWLHRHTSLPRYAVGAPAAAADPRATAVTASNGYRLAAAVAARWLPSAPAVGLVAAGRDWPALVAAARLGRIGAPLLLTGASRMPPATAGRLSATAGGLTEVDLVGGGLAYYDVESGVQAILVGAAPPSAAQ